MINIINVANKRFLKACYVMDLLKIELLIMRMRITRKIIIVYRAVCFW